MPEYRVSKAAQKDIRNIAQYTQKEWGVAQRRKYLTGLEGQFDKLVLNPQLAALRVEFTPPVRIHRYEKHLIVYLAEEEGVLIVRILHASMEIPAHLTDQ